MILLGYRIAEGSLILKGLLTLNADALNSKILKTYVRTDTHTHTHINIFTYMRLHARTKTIWMFETFNIQLQYDAHLLLKTSIFMPVY